MKQGNSENLDDLLKALETKNSYPDSFFVQNLENILLKKNTKRAFVFSSLFINKLNMKKVLISSLGVLIVIVLAISISLMPANTLNNDAIIKKVLAANPGSFGNNDIQDYSLITSTTKVIRGPKFNECPNLGYFGKFTEIIVDKSYFINNMGVLSSHEEFAKNNTLIDYSLENVDGTFYYRGGDYIEQYDYNRYKSIQELKDFAKNHFEIPQDFKPNFNNLKNLTQEGNYYKLIFEETVKCGNNAVPKIAIYRINKDTFKIEDHSEYIYNATSENLFQAVQSQSEIKTLTIEEAVEFFRLKINKPIKVIKTNILYDSNKERTGYAESLKAQNIKFLFPQNSGVILNGYGPYPIRKDEYVEPTRQFFVPGEIGDEIYANLVKESTNNETGYEILLNPNYYTFVNIKIFNKDLNIEKYLSDLIYKELDSKKVYIDDKILNARFFEYEYYYLDGGMVSNDQIVVDGNSNEKCGNVTCFKKKEYYLFFEYENHIYSMHLYLPNVLEENNIVFKSYDANKKEDFDKIVEFFKMQFGLTNK